MNLTEKLIAHATHAVLNAESVKMVQKHKWTCNNGYVSSKTPGKKLQFSYPKLAIRLLVYVGGHTQMMTGVQHPYNHPTHSKTPALRSMDTMQTCHQWSTNIMVSQNIVVPQNGWFLMENPIKMDDLGVPLFLETSISFPTHAIA